MILVKILLIAGFFISVAFIVAVIVLVVNSRKVEKELKDEGFYD